MGVKKKMVNPEIDPKNIENYKDVSGFLIKDENIFGREGLGAQKKLKRVLGK